jgi:hypothetical protein
VLGDPAMWLANRGSRAHHRADPFAFLAVKPAQLFSGRSDGSRGGPGYGFCGNFRTVRAFCPWRSWTGKVRIDNGRVLSGVVLDVRTVRVDL